MKHEEDLICKTLVRWVNVSYPKEAHLFNFSMGGNNLSPARRGICKAMGYRKGWPDYQWAVPRGTFPGLFLEVKTKTGSAQEEQRQLLHHLRLSGFACCVGFGLDECMDLIRVYADGNAAMDYRFDIDTKLERKFFRKENPDVWTP